MALTKALEAVSRLPAREQAKLAAASISTILSPQEGQLLDDAYWPR